MANRVTDRVWQDVGEWLVEWYLHHPAWMLAVCLVVWLLLFRLLFWYFVLTPASANLLANGSFEEQLVSWGSGWLEDTPTFRDQARLYGFIRTSVDSLAAAHWRTDPTEHLPGGHFSLRIEHSSLRQNNLYSTLAQRIRVKERTTYELSLWAKVESMTGDGDLWVSPNGSSVYWDQPKIQVLNTRNEWKPYHLTFNSGDRVDLDIRFVAEAPMVVWVDDVVVRRVPDGDSLVEVLGGWLRRLKAMLPERTQPD